MRPTTEQILPIVAIGDSYVSRCWIAPIVHEPNRFGQTVRDQRSGGHDAFHKISFDEIANDRTLFRHRHCTADREHDAAPVIASHSQHCQIFVG